MTRVAEGESVTLGVVLGTLAGGTQEPMAVLEGGWQPFLNLKTASQSDQQMNFHILEVKADFGEHSSFVANGKLEGISYVSFSV